MPDWKSLGRESDAAVQRRAHEAARAAEQLQLLSDEGRRLITAIRWFQAAIIATLLMQVVAILEGFAAASYSDLVE
jgi:hypothetical protein